MANDTQIRRTPVKRAAAAKTTAKAPPAKKTAARAKTAAPKKATPAKAPPSPPPGWYLDPADQTSARYWDGEGYLGDPVSADLDLTDLPPPGSAGEGDDTTADAEATANAPRNVIVFHGRTMKVNRPGPEQIVVWKRIAERAAGIGRETATPKACPECKGKAGGCEACHFTGSAHTGTVLKLFDRALKIISSVLVDEADRDWVEDQLLEGAINLNAAGEIVSLAVDQMVAATKGRTAPKTGPVATRRARQR